MQFEKSRNRRSVLAGLGAAAVGLSFTTAGCSEKSGTGINGEENKLNFYNWDTYIGNTTLADFAKASGVQVNMSLFATNDEMFAKLKAGNPGFDVVVPSNEFVERMAKADMLVPLDHAKIPNMKNIAAEFLNPDYDPGRKYSMPYTWLVVGLGYRKSKVNGIPDSWKWVYDSDVYKGRIALMSEAADLIRLGARYLGKSVVGVDQPTIDQVRDMLIRQKPNIKTFHEDNGQDLLLAGDVDIVMEYNGDIAQVMQEDPDLGFVIPKEGGLINSDTLVIPKGAPRPDNAHKFINFLLDAQVGKGISETILYPTPNAAAKALMPASFRDNPVIFPSGVGMDASEYGRFEGAATQAAFEEAITKMRAA